jgi:benzil reductase ((S)-benzoin forming)
MLQTAVITGGGTGLGQALAKQLAARGLHVYIIGRRRVKLKETQRFFSKNIFPIAADVGTIRGRKIIYSALKGRTIHFLIHNAAIVSPINPINKISLKEWRRIQATNVEGPLFLTQTLLPQFHKGARILHISSDCAAYPLAHWVPYCTAKAALHMIYACLKKEFIRKDIHIGSVDPGMMDTPMQRFICSDTVHFPEKYTRKELLENNLLHSPDFSAKFCVKMLLAYSTKKFSAKEYSVRQS